MVMRTSPLLTGCIMGGGGGGERESKHSSGGSNYASPAVVQIMETMSQEGGEVVLPSSFPAPPNLKKNHNKKGISAAATTSTTTSPLKGKRLPRMFSRQRMNHPHHHSHNQQHHAPHPFHRSSSEYRHSDSMSVNSYDYSDSVSQACVSVPARLGHEAWAGAAPSLGQEWSLNDDSGTTKKSNRTRSSTRQEAHPSPYSATGSVCNLTIASNDTVKMSNRTALLSSFKRFGGVSRHTATDPNNTTADSAYAAEMATLSASKSVAPEKTAYAGTWTTSGAGGGASSSGSSPVRILKRLNRLRTGIFHSYNNNSKDDESESQRLHSLSEDCHKRGSSGSRSVAGFGYGDSRSRARCVSDDASTGYFSTFFDRGRSSRKSQARRGGGGRGSTTVSFSPADRAAAEQRARLDQSIRGRFDGLDVLSLGPAYLSSTCSVNNARVNDDYTNSDDANNEEDQEDTAGDFSHRPERILPWQSLPSYTFTGKSLYLTPADMVSRMLWTCSQNSNPSAPEVILEGFIPGEDRWSVRIEQSSSSASPEVVQAAPSPPSSSPKTTPFTSSSSSPSSWLWKQKPSDRSNSSNNYHHEGPPTITPVLTEEETSDDGGSPIVPTYQLWPTLWGNVDKAPERADLEQIAEEDPLLHLAAEHSIPIDLDENTFCVSEKCHLEIIHTFLQTSLSVGRFDTAVMIVSKLLKGMDLKVQEESLRFLKGAALHNLGVLFMWQGEYEAAVEQFQMAVQERTKSLPKDHADICVSMVWKGLAQFALGRLDDALFCHELALESMMVEQATLSSPGEMARSKVLNNIGVIHYQKDQYMNALKQFTASLEIQRGWLDGSIRRDSIVYVASATLSNMGKLYLERGDVDLAYFVYEEALLLQTTIFCKDHDLVLDSLKSLALTRARDKQVKKALQILQGCLRSQTTRFGKDSTESIDTLGYMGYLYEHLECPEDALKCLATVKKWQRMHLPPGHPALRKSKETVNRLEEAIGKKVSVWV